MKKNNYFYIVLMFLLFSCTEKHEDKIVETEILTETPEVLIEKNDSYLKSRSKNYTIDIVTKLFDEALEKDEILKELIDRINKIGLSRRDSTKQYRIYSQTNESYWNSAKSYIGQIKDTVLQKSIKNVFNNFEKDYYSSLLPFDDKLNELKIKSISLNDNLILLKLFITRGMIGVYQENEMPNIEPLNRIIDSYDELILESDSILKKYK